MRSCHSTSTAAQARRLCYFSLGFRHPAGAARSRAHCIIGVPPVFPIRAKGDNQKPESQTWAAEPFEMWSRHSANTATISLSLRDKSHSPIEAPRIKLALWECVPTSRTGSDDPIFQPAKFSAENPLRELFTAQIHIVSNAAKQTIDA